MKISRRHNQTSLHIHFITQNHSSYFCTVVSPFSFRVADQAERTNETANAEKECQAPWGWITWPSISERWLFGYWNNRKGPFADGVEGGNAEEGGSGEPGPCATELGVEVGDVKRAGIEVGDLDATGVEFDGEGGLGILGGGLARAHCSRRRDSSARAAACSLVGRPAISASL